MFLDSITGTEYLILRKIFSKCSVWT